MLNNNITTQTSIHEFPPFYPLCPHPFPCHVKAVSFLYS
jgi:hypothetical protein